MIGVERHRKRYRANVELAVRAFLTAVDLRKFKQPNQDLLSWLRSAFQECRVVSQRELRDAVIEYYEGLPIDLSRFVDMLGN